LQQTFSRHTALTACIALITARAHLKMAPVPPEAVPVPAAGAVATTAATAAATAVTAAADAAAPISMTAFRLAEKHYQLHRDQDIRVK